MKLTGSLDTFGEGSERRAAFVSGLAAVLEISEKQIVIISVTEGSVIVELGFVRLAGVLVSTTEIVLRLKNAAKSGQLDKFGLTDLSVGTDNVFAKSSASSDSAVIVGASIGGAIGIALIAALIRWRWRRLQVAIY